MLCALIGAVTALLLLARAHDRQIQKLQLPATPGVSL
jgi:hypothetical protein